MAAQAMRAAVDGATRGAVAAGPRHASSCLVVACTGAPARNKPGGEASWS